MKLMGSVWKLIYVLPNGGCFKGVRTRQLTLYLYLYPYLYRALGWLINDLQGGGGNSTPLRSMHPYPSEEKESAFDCIAERGLIDNLCKLIN